MQTVDQTAEIVAAEDLYHCDHAMWVAQAAAAEGFPIAGFVRDIYEDAVILIGPTFRFHWEEAKIKMGRVIHISEIDDGHSVTSFVLLTKDGTQVPCTYGAGYDCFFALPENTEGAFR